MKKKLLVVEDAFTARGPGVLVTPRVVAEDGVPASLEVRLRAPDGAERVAKATFDVAHVRGPLAPFAMLRLHGVSVADVPAGTEIWTEG